jgi:hypothetical protein
VHVRSGYEDDRASGLVIVSNDRQRAPDRMIVLAIGETVRGIRPGDVVLVAPGQGVQLRDGTRLVQRTQILARLRD